MIDVLAVGSHTDARRVRGPAYAVMTECLRIQVSARRQPMLARLFGQNPILPDARSWYRGALGEIDVAKVLAGLGPAWTVLHADDSPALLIGPAGAFTVATKNHSRQRVWIGDDTILVNGHRTNHVRDARLEARAISRLLGITVTPVLAIVDPAHFDLKGRPDGVEVLAATQLATFLSRRKRRLTDETVAALLAAAAVPSTWSADVFDETLRHEARFARLVAEVDAAARRRAMWIAASGVVTTSVVVGATLAM